MRIVLRHSTGRHIIRDLKETSTLAELQASIAAVCGVPIENQMLNVGFPPQKLQTTDSSRSLAQAGVKNGDALTVDRSEVEVASASSKAPTPASETSATGAKEPRMVRRTVRADNSCLFHSISHLLQDREVGEASILRTLVAASIESDPSQWSELVLGKLPHEYCAWIQQPSSWGGAVELRILSSMFEVEIIALCVQTAKLLRFGEGSGYRKCIYLIFDVGSVPGVCPLILFTRVACPKLSVFVFVC